MEPKLGFCIGSDVCPGLSKLIEECGEVMQVAGKLIATGGRPEHWDGTNLRTRLSEELADLMAAIIFVAETNGLDRELVEPRTDAKLAIFRQWHTEQKEKR